MRKQAFGAAGHSLMESAADRPFAFRRVRIFVESQRHPTLTARPILAFPGFLLF
jgi:hypothetical protein